MKPSCRHWCAMLAGGLAHLCVANSPAQAVDPALVAAAEREGQVVVYGGDISETPHQIKRFMEI